MKIEDVTEPGYYWLRTTVKGELLYDVPIAVSSRTDKTLTYRSFGTDREQTLNRGWWHLFSAYKLKPAPHKGEEE
jgi:hypothetical protein